MYIRSLLVRGDVVKDCGFETRRKGDFNCEDIKSNLALGKMIRLIEEKE
jgi:hypothetical protein